MRVALGLLGRGGLIALAVVSGCDGGAAGGDGASAPAAGSPAAGELAGELAGGTCGPRTMSHRHGATRLSGDPERVVPLSFRDQEAVLALEEVPVAVQDGYYATPYIEWPWVEPRLEGAEPRVLAAGEVNFEEVAGLRPDLILGAASGLSAQEYRILSTIAPTVGQLPDFVDYGVPWQAGLRAAGVALCRQARAEALVAELESEIEAVRERHRVLTGATGVVAMTGGPGGAIWVFGPQDSRGRFLEALGLRIPEEIEALAGDRFVATLSAERMDLVDADLLIWIATPEQRAALEGTALYQQLEVVREGGVVWLESADLTTAAMTNTTALNLPYLLETLVPRIVEALTARGDARA